MAQPLRLPQSSSNRAGRQRPPRSTRPVSSRLLSVICVSSMKPETAGRSKTASHVVRKTVRNRQRLCPRQTRPSWPVRPHKEPTDPEEGAEPVRELDEVCQYGFGQHVVGSPRARIFGSLQEHLSQGYTPSTGRHLTGRYGVSPMAPAVCSISRHAFASGSRLSRKPRANARRLIVVMLVQPSTLHGSVLSINKLPPDGRTPILNFQRDWSTR